ncbi:MAG: hypothetical protein JWR37_3553 [Mycobacterium sp.]|jgi:hypothetical protein|nr:hypothetical protein [Mycobacterium sp.]
MLTYGVHLTRVLAITRNQISERSGTLTSTWAITNSYSRPSWPSYWRNCHALGHDRHCQKPILSGINPRARRNTALIRLASELPAAVLADLLAVDIATATRWAGYAKRDWQPYLAKRRASTRKAMIETAHP